jgi:hypothetical protein
MSAAHLPRTGAERLRQSPHVDRAIAATGAQAGEAVGKRVPFDDATWQALVVLGATG